MRDDLQMMTRDMPSAPPPASAAVTPLVTAAEMFPALERLILKAEREVLLAFRIFDARALLRSEEAEKLELKTWADLLHHTAARGVAIRLLMSDFDPVFAADLHRAAWRSAGQFATRLNGFPGAEIVCALHDCAPAPLWHRVFSAATRKRLDKLRQTPEEHLTGPQMRALSGDFCLRPVSLHQKFAVIDGTDAIIGGIDVDDRRWDDDDHDKRPEETWHDVSLQVSGPVTGPIRAHFADCWSRARATCGTVFSADATPVPQLAPTSAGVAPRLLRTLSTHAPGALRFGPKVETREIEQAHLDAFAAAEHSVYIETQFFRHIPLARTLARRAREIPDLNLVLVVPTEPERIIFGRDNGMDARHAQALQIRCLAILRRAFGDRMTVVSPAQPRPAPDGTPMPVAGAGIIYLHSKVTLVDDRIGIVGSANLNGRSLLWDTEAALEIRDPEAVRALRLRLSSKWLADAPGDPALAQTWTDAATAAAALPPEKRTTKVLPYPEERNRRFARYVPILPAAMF
ncbi:phospholipase D family protein [Primorskyibacter flagellatus]|nr:phospholipase D family protein [Primorskyibacter flagellatus]